VRRSGCHLIRDIVSDIAKSVREPSVDFSYLITGDAGGNLLQLRGELDLAAADRLQEALPELLRSHPGSLVVDLRPLTFLDSSGLRVLLSIHAAALEGSFDLCIVRGGERIDKVLQFSGVEDLLPLVDVFPDGSG
jgi:anti-sigma B factor antagonist